MVLFWRYNLIFVHSPDHYRILLLFYYKPTEAAAFSSVKFIMSKTEFGWLIRSVHAWSANLMVFSVLVHMFSVFFPARVPAAPRTNLGYRSIALFFNVGDRIYRLSSSLE